MTLGVAPGSGGKDMAAFVDGGTAPAETLPLSGHSRLVQRLRRRYAAELALLAQGVPTLQGMAAAYERVA